MDKKEPQITVRLKQNVYDILNEKSEKYSSVSEYVRSIINQYIEGKKQRKCEFFQRSAATFSAMSYHLLEKVVKKHVPNGTELSAEVIEEQKLLIEKFTKVD